jgi:16S rRNA (cytidine1402-2'-O)-methyltransferase
VSRSPGTGTLYVVATPIGNLDDLTIRATKALAACDAVLAEDTRRTRNLLGHLGLSKPLRRFDAQAESSSVDRIAQEIASGTTLALVSDAGTPTISDPGAELVRAVIAGGGQVIAIPGASAVLCALVGSGLAERGFRFFGFLPRGGGERAELLARIVETPEPVVLYEAGNRAKATLSELAARAPDRPAAVARELTKVHEEFRRGSLSELAASVEEELLGEVTIVLGASAQEQIRWDDQAVDARIDLELHDGRGAKETADIVAALAGRPRREIYARVIARRGRAPGGLAGPGGA